MTFVMLGAGTAIGAAIFSVLGPAALVGGAGILITMALETAPMALLTLVDAWLTSAAPSTAASYDLQRRIPLLAAAKTAMAPWATPVMVTARRSWRSRNR